jgi:hypothetical protein
VQLADRVATDRAREAAQEALRGIDRKLASARRLTARYERTGKALAGCTDQIDATLGDLQTPLGGLVK